MLRTRIDVGAILTGRTRAQSRRRPLVDVRETPAFARPDRSTRHSRALALADAAMILAVGDTPRAVRRCAMTVDRALALLDDISDRPQTVTDAADMILSRCRSCGQCGGTA